MGMRLGFFLGISMTTVVGLATDEPVAPIEIRFVDVPVSIDGSATEWAGVPRHSITQTWEGRAAPCAEDLTVEAAFAFDDMYFYALVEARDDVFEFPDRSWRYGDGFYLTFAEPTPEFRSNRYVTFGLSIEEGGFAKFMVSRDGEGFPRVDNSGIRFAALADEEADRIVYEAAIPWALLAPLQPLVDEAWGLNLIYVDRDEGQREMLFLRFDRDYDTENTDQRMTRPIRFSLGDVQKDFVQFRAYRSHARSGGSVPIGIGAAYRDSQDGATVEWRVTNAEGRKLERGSIPLTLNRGISHSRLEIPIPDVPSGPVRVMTLLRDGGGSKLGQALFSVMVFNAKELAEQGAVLRRFADDPKITEAIKASIPSAQFHLERVEAFMADATPFENTTDVRTNLEGLRRGISDLEAGRPVFADRRGVFRHAHRSVIDGTLQPYSVAIPNDYDPQRKYPLLIVLHGSGVDERDVIYTGARQAAAVNWLTMAPKARGLSDWYQGDSGRDVFECIEDVCKRYSIDRRCIVLSGFSCGGFGAWRLGLQRPELFAGVAVLSGALEHGGEDLTPLVEKVEGLPFLVIHGTADNAVSVEHARRAVAILRQRGYPALTYLEIEGAGHGGYEAQVGGQFVDWLRERQREAAEGAGQHSAD